MFCLWGRAVAVGCLDYLAKVNDGLNYLGTRSLEPNYKSLTPAPPEDARKVRHDWVAYGAVTPVRHQFKSGTCYAVASVGSVESARYINTGILEELSVQQVVDCGVDGWFGGRPRAALEYIARTGLTTEKAYPFIPKKCDITTMTPHQCKRRCREKKHNKVAMISGYGKTEHENPDDLERGVLINPVVISVWANYYFQKYRDGVISRFDCPPPTLEELKVKNLWHTVLVVAFDEDSVSGHRFWVCKNSWGEGWGYHGYFLIDRDVDHPWGVAGMYFKGGYYPTGYYDAPLPPPPSPSFMSKMWDLIFPAK